MVVDGFGTSELTFITETGYEKIKAHCSKT